MNSMFQNMFYLICILVSVIILFFLFAFILKKSKQKKWTMVQSYFLNFFQQKEISFDSSIFQIILQEEILFEVFFDLAKECNEAFSPDKLKNLKSFFEENLEFIRKQSVSFQMKFLSFLSVYPSFLEGRGNSILSYVAECTISDSSFLVDQSFFAICRFGNSELVKKTLAFMNQKQIYYTPKLVLNSLLNFQGDAKLLKEFLAKDIKKYMNCYQQACIEFLGIKKINISTTLIPILTDLKEEKDVRIACIRYFAKVIYKPVVPILYEFLKDDVGSWEYATVAAKTLGSYPSKDTTNHLLLALGSYSWYVRNNASASIVKINDRDVVKHMLRKIGDKYAYEALSYQLKLQEEKK